MKKVSISYFNYYTYISKKILSGSKFREEVKKYLVSFLRPIMKKICKYITMTYITIIYLINKLQ